MNKFILSTTSVDNVPFFDPIVKWARLFLMIVNPLFTVLSVLNRMALEWILFDYPLAFIFPRVVE